MKICAKCGGNLIKKATRRTPEQLKKPYYYTAYYYCQNCKRLYHDEAFKVENQQMPSLFASTIETKLQQLTRKTHDIYDVEIWTDGACVFNGQANAKAAWAFVSGKTERAGLIEGKQTNNIAEALAIYYALEWAADQNHKNIKIYSDSLITINNMKKSPKLIKNNTEIFEKINQLIDDCDLTVTFEKVLGHSGDINNERADKLATELASKGKGA